MRLAFVRYLPRIIETRSGVAAFCDALGQAGSGSTESEARDRLTAAISSYCRALARKGLLAKALSEAGVIVSTVDVAAAEGEEVVVVDLKEGA